MSDLTLTVVSMDRIYSRPRLFKRWMALSTVNISNQRIMQLVSLILIRWIVNYPVDSAIQRLNLGQINKQSFWIRASKLMKYTSLPVFKNARKITYMCKDCIFLNSLSSSPLHKTSVTPDTFACSDSELWIDLFPRLLYNLTWHTMTR